MSLSATIARSLLGALCAVVLAHLALPAAAASKADMASMQVKIVRANWAGCEPNCPEWISAQGKIDEATPAKFKKALAQIGNRRLPVLIDSLGGSGEDAYAVGRMIRAKGLDIAVSQTQLVTCLKTDKACRTTSANGVPLGKPRTLMSKCASACAFILAAGARRMAGIGTFVGVHQVKTFETRIRSLRTYRTVGSERVLVSEKRISAKTVPVATGDAVYRRMQRYFAEMGVGAAIMPMIRATPHSSIHVLSNDDFKATNLVTERTSAEQLLKAATRAKPPTVTKPPSKQQAQSTVTTAQASSRQ